MNGLTGYEVMGQRTWPGGIDIIVYFGVYGCCGLFLFIAVVVVWKRLKKHRINRNIKKD
jgi:hypothetical protein